MGDVQLICRLTGNVAVHIEPFRPACCQLTDESWQGTIRSIGNPALVV
ncbi:hypothetical protein HMPREF3226_01491 [Prevotella corporis]|uniref:Uncharacterized protein n=1 Tax=Prevotella corporis TaxID=28128 RepID=A0A133Q6X8_9BACT|nr:hypothetical protein HMPREF3226_01491 [Prevotella corporis]